MRHERRSGLWVPGFRLTKSGAEPGQAKSQSSILGQDDRMEQDAGTTQTRRSDSLASISGSPVWLRNPRYRLKKWIGPGRPSGWPFAVKTIFLLIASNVFMTVAWYGHL